VQMMRGMSDAILTGIGTVLADDPLLTCRLPGMADRSPVRVVLDGKLRLPAASRLALSATVTPLWVITDEIAPQAGAQALEARGAHIFRLASNGAALDLVSALRLIAQRGITRVMVEAGPILTAAFLRADLVDEAALFRSPTVIGAQGIDALERLPLEALTRSSRLVACGREPVGDDTVEYFERP